MTKRFDGISGKTAVVLALLLILASVTQERDYAREMREAARGIMSILQENPSPEEIEGSFKGGKVFIGRERSDEPDRARWDFSHRYDRKKDDLYFFEMVGTNVVLGEKSFAVDLKRGLPYEELERILTDTLSKYFGSTPEVKREKLFSSTRNQMTWNVADNGRRYEIWLYISHNWYLDPPGYFKWRYLWTKPEDVYISLKIQKT